MLYKFSMDIIYRFGGNRTISKTYMERILTNKNILLICFLLFGYSLNAQVSFYLLPTINMKTQHSFFGNNNFTEKYSELSNKYFTFRNDKLHFDRNNINFGINVGLKLKNKHFFEFGYSTDNSGVAVGVVAQSYMNTYQDTEGDFYNSASSTYSQTGSSFSRISFNYAYLFYKNKNKTLQARFVGGLGLLHKSSVNRKKNKYHVDYIPHFTHGQISTDVFITEHYSRVTNIWRNSFYLNFGLGLDFYTKKANTYLFSFDVTYHQGTRAVQIDDNFIKVVDTGDELNFHYRVGSRASGIYFTLSRRFQVYPWISKKNKGL